MTLNDFISKFPIEQIIKTEILDNKITLPTIIEPNQFYKDFKDKINSNILTNEKALFICSKLNETKFQTAKDLLVSKLKFN